MEKLLINKTLENPSTGEVIMDSNGKPLGKGSFYLRSELGNHNNPFEKELVIIPIAAYSKFMHYDSPSNRFDAETILVSAHFDKESGNFIEEEPIDNQGGVRCGRPSNKELDELKKTDPQEARKLLEKAKWYLVIYAQAFFMNKSEPVLVELTLPGGSGFDLNTSLKKAAKPLYNNQFRLFLKEGRDLKNRPTFSPQLELLSKKDRSGDTALAKEIAFVEQHVTGYNQRIRDAFEEAVLVRNGGTPTTPGPAAESDLDDEIPF